ncbi:MAG: glycosyltransferase family 4 protein [Chloroflexota bacterium]|nr:glycosyltransferase family 4 protein [Chloroflexota bacterium]
MKIAMLTSLNGGVGTFVANLCEELSKYPDIDQIDIFGYSDYKRIPLPGLSYKVNIKMNERSPYLFTIKILRWMPYLGDYDLIHTNQAHLFGQVYYVARLWKIPCIYTTAFNPVDEIKNASFLKKRLLGIEASCIRFASRKANVHLAVSDYCRKTMQDEMGILPQTVIYHGIDDKRFAYSKEKRDKTRSALKVEDNTALLLYVGMLETHKDVITLIDTMSRLKTKYTSRPITLVIVGRGPAYAEIAGRVRQNGLESTVNIKTDVVRDITEYYSAADVFVFPSLGEGFGFVFLEAMACGLPIIAANAGSAPEVIGDAGLLFKPRDSEELADRIIEMLNNQQLYREVRESGLERVKQFTWERAAKQYYQVYEQVLEHR